VFFPNYLANMNSLAGVLHVTWSYSLGKMFRSAMLPKFVNFVLMFYQHKPVDWLLDNYFWVQECHGVSHTPLQLDIIRVFT